MYDLHEFLSVCVSEFGKLILDFVNDFGIIM